MIYTLYLAACLAARPADCRVYEFPLRRLPANPVAAFVEVQTIVALWQQSKPEFDLISWRLVPGQGI